MASVFIVMLLIVQIAFLLVVRSSVSGAVDAAVRDAARDVDRLPLHEERLAERLSAVLAHSEILDVSLDRDGGAVVAEVSYRWIPPGPVLTPLTVVVGSRRTVVVPP